MQEAERLSLEEIRRFVEASEAIRFTGEKREQVYGWIERVLCEQQYAKQGKVVRGLLRRYIEKMTGKSRAQVTRLIGCYHEPDLKSRAWHNGLVVDRMRR